MRSDKYEAVDSVKTPWGEVAELRGRRLSPGPQPRGAEATRRHQSERLYGAVVALAAEQGYSKTSLRDLARTSGVTEVNFYKCFRSKDECFLAAVDELYGTSIRMVEAGYAGERDWRQRVRAAIGALIELIVSQPAAAQVCVVNVYEAGAPGSARVERALAQFERLLARSFAASPGRALPGAIVAALIAGVQMVIHNRLQRGDVEVLPVLGPALADWVLSYAAPPPALPVPPAAPDRQRRAAAPAEVPMEERLLHAVAEVCANEGVSRLTGQAIVATARTSLRALYQHFPGGPEEAFLFATEEIVGRCVAVSRAAYGTARSWPAQMNAVNRELFGYLASEPAFAATVLVEVLAAGPKALALRDRVLAPFGELFEGGEALAPEVPEVVREAIVFSVYSLVSREIAERGVAGVPGLVPTATYMELTPYLGAAGAAAAAGRLAEAAAIAEGRPTAR